MNKTFVLIEAGVHATDLGLVILNAHDAILRVHSVAGYHTYIAEIQTQSETDSAREIRAIMDMEAVFATTTYTVLRTHEKRVTVAIGQGSCQLLAELDHVPEVGETITIPEDRVLGAKGLGMGLVGRTIVVTARGEDLEVSGEMVPHIWARTENFPAEEDSGD